MMRWLVLVCSVALLLDVSWAKAVTAVDELAGNHLVKSRPNSQLIGFCGDATSFKACLKMKSLILLEDLSLKDNPIHLFGSSFLLVKDAEAGTGGRMLPTTVDELESTLPLDESLREETLDQLIYYSLAKFINSRAVQIRLQDLSFWNNWNTLEEGRKKKGSGGAGWALMSAGGMMGALGLGSVAMMAGKAMMISMMALMLSALAALKKGGGGGDHAATTYEVINVPTGHGHHGRSLPSNGRPRSLTTGVDLPNDTAGAVVVYGDHLQQPPLTTSRSVEPPSEAAKVELVYGAHDQQSTPAINFSTPRTPADLKNGERSLT